MYYQAGDDSLLVVDRRGDTERRVELYGPAISLLDATQRPRLERKLRLEWRHASAFDITLDHLVRQGFILRDAGKLLALPTRGRPLRRPVLDSLESYFAPDDVTAT